MQCWFLQTSEVHFSVFNCAIESCPDEQKKNILSPMIF